MIKDFDPSDQFVVRVPDGGALKVRYTDSFDLVTGGIANPLIGTVTGGGTLVEVSGKTAGSEFNRVFLQVYREGLVQLDQDPADGIYSYGGSEYYLRNNATESLVFSELVARDLSSNNPLLPLSAVGVDSPF